MAAIVVPKELHEWLEANPRRPGEVGPLKPQEREALALQLEWLAAEVRENDVWESSWSRDREVEDTHVEGHGTDRVIGPWKHTVEVQFK